MSNPYQQALGQTLIDRSIRERIVLVGVIFDGHDEEETDESLDELARLIDTAGADEAARMTQRRAAPDPTSVSYTPRTLPTKREVWISVDHGSTKKKKKAEQ